MVFQQREEAKQLLDGIVSSMMEGEKKRRVVDNGVSATKGRKSKQVLDRVVSAMKIVRKWWAGVFREWEEMKNVEQQCFSIRKNGERLLVTVFQQWKGENEKLLVVVFQQQKRER